MNKIFVFRIKIEMVALSLFLFVSLLLTLFVSALDSTVIYESEMNVYDR